MLSYIQNYIDTISNDKILIGVSILFLNIASKHIDIKLTKNQEALIKKISKEVLVFFMLFIGTRDILISLLLTIIYWIIVSLLLNEDSSFCVLPDNLKNLYKLIDINSDNIISQEELNHAIDILEKSKKQQNLESQKNI